MVAGTLPPPVKGSRVVAGLENRFNVGRKMVQGDSSMTAALGMQNKEAQLVGIGKELVTLVKAIGVVALFMLFALLLILVVLLVK